MEKRGEASLQPLRCAMARELSGDESAHETPAVTNLRHVSLLEDARTSLMAAVTALSAGEIPEEFLLADPTSGEPVAVSAATRTFDLGSGKFDDKISPADKAKIQGIVDEIKAGKTADLPKFR